jgi:phospholipid/cholesterol/gamma-HCH transport system substrate-binding protein
METKANYALIGLFTIAIVAGVFGFVYWFQNVGVGERAFYRVVFDGSVSGLRTGGSVLFNGIRVGEVSELKLNADLPQQVAVLIAIDKSVSVRSDTQAGIEFQGLTGIAAVTLSGGTATLPTLQGSKSAPPTLVAARSATQDITQGARDVMSRIDNFIAENQKAFRSTLQNLDTFTGALARNSERIDHIVAGMENLIGGTDGKSGEANAAARSIRELADNLDKRTAEITEGINKFTSTGAKQFELLSKDARNTLANIDRTVRNIDKNPSRLFFGDKK